MEWNTWFKPAGPGLAHYVTDEGKSACGKFASLLPTDKKATNQTRCSVCAEHAPEDEIKRQDVHAAILAMFGGN